MMGSWFYYACGPIIHRVIPLPVLQMADSGVRLLLSSVKLLSVEGISINWLSSKNFCGFEIM